MELNKCARCGSFYVSEGSVCPKCSNKEALEYATFKSYIEENGFTNSLNTIVGETGISEKNINRFLKFDEFKNYIDKMDIKKDESGFTGITFN